MDVMAAALPLQNPYQDIFQQHIIRRTPLILRRLRQVAPHLPSPLLEQALHILDFALKVDDVWPDTRDLLLTMAPLMEQAGHRDEWMPYLRQGITLSRQLGDPAAGAELHLQLGILYQLRSKYDAAREHLEAGVAGFRKINARRRDQARALNQLAYVARLQRCFEEATGLVETAYQLLDNGDMERAFSNFVLGLVALDQREWPEASRLSQQAFDQWQPADNRRMMGRSLMCRSVALEKMKQYPEAIVVAKQAIALFEAIADPIYLAATRMNLGNVYNLSGQPAQALALFLPAKKTFNDRQDIYSLSLVTHNLGMAYHRLQRWDEAQDFYLQSIQHRRALGNIINLANSLDGLGRLYLDQGNLAEAKATLTEALHELANVAGEPGYQQRLGMVTEHLNEVNEQLKNQ